MRPWISPHKATFGAAIFIPRKIKTPVALVFVLYTDILYRKSKRLLDKINK